MVRRQTLPFQFPFRWQVLAPPAPMSAKGWGDKALGGTVEPGVLAPPKATSPRPVPGLADMQTVAIGNNHALALRKDSTVWAWGKNADGQLGDGSTNFAVAPVKVSGLTDVVAVSAGSSTTLALTRDGSLWIWGVVDPLNVATADICTFINSNTHGDPPIVNVPCAKTPVKVVLR